MIKTEVPTNQYRLIEVSKGGVQTIAPLNERRYMLAWGHYA